MKKRIVAILAVLTVFAAVATTTASAGVYKNCVVTGQCVIQFP